MATTRSVLSPAEIERRRRGLKSVVGTMAAEGEIVSDAAMKIFEQYVRGEITAEERNAAIRALHL